MLNLFQGWMQLFASPVMILLALWIFAESMNQIHKEKNKKILYFLTWSLFVIIGSFFIEVVGVTTGMIFGDYDYTNILSPRIWNTPVAIGFAWYTMLLSSLVVVDKLMSLFKKNNVWLKSTLVAVLMVLFDVLMEIAVKKLGYWQWENHTIPLQNYIAWLMISFMFAVIGFKTRVLPSKFPLIVFHIYFAQMFYFGLIVI